MALAADNLAVAVNYRSGGEQARSVVAHIRDAGGTAEAFPADVTDEDSLFTLVQQVTQSLGPIDVAVQNSSATPRRLPCDGSASQPTSAPPEASSLRSGRRSSPVNAWLSTAVTQSPDNTPAKAASKGPSHGNRARGMGTEAPHEERFRRRGRTISKCSAVGSRSARRSLRTC
jgi:NAD(P)-dependent dehydrogenase (short-subunit alcohol dehydrogenase family)